MNIVKECLTASSEWDTKLQALKLMTAFHNNGGICFQIYSDVSAYLNII